MSESKLISVSDLISSGWTQFLKDWRRLFEISIRFVLAGIIVLAGSLIAERAPIPAGAADAIVGIASLLSIIITFYTVILLIDYQLKKETEPEGEVPIDTKRAWNLFLPLAWVSVLNFIAVVGGLIVFVLPGLWLSILLGYSIMFLIEENRRGTQALAASAALVKGRWWATLGRVLAPAVLVAILSFLLTFVITFLLGILVGFDRVFFFASQVQPAQATSGTIAGIQTALSSLVQIVLVPLSIIYQVKVYRSLKETR